MATVITQTANPAGVSASATVATYTGVSIGTAAPNRIIVVVVGTELAAANPSAATIDGNAMTAGTGGDQGAVQTNLFYLAYPTGTTADIAVTFSAVSPTSTQNHIAVYSVVGGTYSSKGGTQSTDMDSTVPLTTGSITIPTGGGFIAVAAKATDTVRAAWANATEDLDVDAGGFGFTTATRTTALTTTAVTCTGTTNGEDGAMSWIIFADNTSPTVALSSPSDTASVGDTTPDLTFTGTDTESNDIRYNVQVYQQIATDDFNRADSATLGANWTTCNGDDGSPHELKIVSNQVKPTDSAVDNIARRTAETFSNDQYSQVTLSNIDTGSHLGCGVRFSANNGYIGQVRKASNVLRITKKTGTTYATLTEDAATLTNGDVIRIEAVGSKISLYQNGIFINSVTDTDFASGSPAINADITGDILDNWEGGDIIIDAVSGTDAGFSGSPDNSDPFASAQAVTYTVQSALSVGTTYYWRVRAIDPSGSNSYGAWATTRSFTVSSGGGTVVKDMIGGFIPFAR
jgi:hypothetical protein